MRFELSDAGQRKRWAGLWIRLLMTAVSFLWGPRCCRRHTWALMAPVSWHTASNQRRAKTCVWQRERECVSMHVCGRATSVCSPRIRSAKTAGSIRGSSGPKCPKYWNPKIRRDICAIDVWMFIRSWWAGGVLHWQPLPAISVRTCVWLGERRRAERRRERSLWMQSPFAITTRTKKKIWCVCVWLSCLKEGQCLGCVTMIPPC